APIRHAPISTQAGGGVRCRRGPRRRVARREILAGDVHQRVLPGGLLEMMRTAKVISGGGYAHNDPVFGRHGALYMVPYVRRDMLITDNHLPLLLLQKLVAVETGKEAQRNVNKMVLRFIWPRARCRRRRNTGRSTRSTCSARVCSVASTIDHAEEANGGIIRSAAELYEAGIRFRRPHHLVGGGALRGERRERRGRKMER
ncbi:hypothetical protein EE612_041318, partial [Oryza sativa]